MPCGVGVLLFSKITLRWEIKKMAKSPFIFPFPFSLTTGKFGMLFCRSLIFQNQIFLKIPAGIPSKWTNSLDPDQTRRFVRPNDRSGSKLFAKVTAEDTIEQAMS